MRHKQGGKNRKWGEPFELGRGGSDFVNKNKGSSGAKSWVDELPLGEGDMNPHGFIRGRTRTGRVARGIGGKPKDPTEK